MVRGRGGFSGAFKVAKNSSRLGLPSELVDQYLFTYLCPQGLKRGLNLFRVEDGSDDEFVI